MVKKLVALLLMGVMVFALAGCSEESVITLGQGDWDSNAFHDEVVKFIVENGYDVNVQSVTADTSVMIASMKNNTLDLCMELWSDNVPTYEADIAGGDYLELGVNFDDNQQGLYVPRYLIEGADALAPNLKTVEDLKDYAHLFQDPENPGDGIIYGGPEGWAATIFMHDKMMAYGLDEQYNFRTIDSGATLAATLAGAYERQEPWVGYYWEPTWVLGLYDMVLLDDSPYNAEDFEEGIGAFPTVKVTITATQEFVDTYPELVDFLNNYETTSHMINQALAYMQENSVEADAAALWFLNEYDDLWRTWVDEGVYDKVKTALDAAL